ncbi:MAG: alkaline phosphatase [Candidatus Kariarchaeaceae archaeon]|jgi:alkaline phosphatase
MKFRFVVLSLLIGLLAFGTPTSATHNDEGIDNVILLIGDGMGYEHIRLGSLVEYGIDDGLFMQQFYRGNLTTASDSSEVTDSAAAATAFATGVRTFNSYLSMLPNGTELPTILEYAQQQGHLTGLVSTANFYHATPAAFASHQDSRYDYTEIISQMLTADVDVVLGGGMHQSNFRDATNFDSTLSAEGYTLVEDRTELLASTATRLFGAFGTGHLPYEAGLDLSDDVRLRDMTQVALDRLQTDDGLFLMIESGRIDHAGHDNNVVNGALEVIEFDHVVKMVHEFYEANPNTLVVITADHETGGLSIDSSAGLDETLPGMEMSEAAERSRRMTRAGQLTTSYSTTGHTGVNVPIYAFGMGADDLFSSEKMIAFDNTDIYDVLREAMDGTFTTSETSETSSDISSETLSETLSETSEFPTDTAETPVLLVPVMLVPLVKIRSTRRD